MTNERMGLTANWIVVGQAVKRLVNSHIVLAHTQISVSVFGAFSESMVSIDLLPQSMFVAMSERPAPFSSCAAALHWMGRNYCGTRRQWHEPMKKANKEEEEE